MDVETIVKRINTGVLVIGGGGAAFRAAIAARENGANTLLVSKGPLARCGATPMAGADFTVDGRTLHEMGFPGDPNDSPEQFFNDIVYQSFHLSNQELLEQYVTNTRSRLTELLDWGVKVRSSEQRAIYTTGIEIIDALQRKAQAVGVEFLQDVMMLDLIVRDHRVVGALGLEVGSGEYVCIAAKAVVMGTGGWHKAFWPTTGSRDLSGDGMAMALRAGAPLGNMEFVTFACPILLGPPHCQGSLATYIMILTGGGRLTNALGEEFCKKYDPLVVDKGTYMEWNKLFLSLACALEIRAGKGSSLGGVYYGRGQVPWEEFSAKVTASIPNWKYKAMDLSALADTLRSGGCLDVGPVAEYFEGGIAVDRNFASGMPGLYAAGECCMGPFGANRVCSAITEMLVQGADAGGNAAQYAAHMPEAEPGPSELEPLTGPLDDILRRKQGPRPAQVRRELQLKAHKWLGPVRSPDELEGLLGYLDELKNQILPSLSPASARRVYNKDWLDALELPNLVMLLESAARGALMRTESRGVHFREDYPHTDNQEWLLEIIDSYADGEHKLGTRAPVIRSLAPDKKITPYMEMLKQMMAAHSPVGGHH